MKKITIKVANWIKVGIDGEPRYDDKTIITGTTKKEKEILHKKYKFFTDFEDPCNWNRLTKKAILLSQAMWYDINEKDIIDIKIKKLMFRFRNDIGGIWYTWYTDQTPSNAIMLAAYYYAAGRIRKLKKYLKVVSKDEADSIRKTIRFIQNEGGVDKFIAKYSL